MDKLLTHYPPHHNSLIHEKHAIQKKFPFPPINSTTVHFQDTFMTAHARRASLQCLMKLSQVHAQKKTIRSKKYPFSIKISCQTAVAIRRPRQNYRDLKHYWPRNTEGYHSFTRHLWTITAEHNRKQPREFLLNKCGVLCFSQVMSESHTC